MGKKSGKGTHGSLSKAGKMRSQQPRLWKISDRKSKSGFALRNKRKSKIPRISNRIKYNKEVTLEHKRDNKQERKGRYSKI